eukprot:Gb_24383 [translate_table: standard]
MEEAELAIAGFSGDGAGILAAANTIISTFALVFVAEWGDKSFFSTIALAAASSPLGVVVGAVAGHGVATLVKVCMPVSLSLLATYFPAISKHGEFQSCYTTLGWLMFEGPDIGFSAFSSSSQAAKHIELILVAFEVRAFLRCFTVFLVQIAVLGGSLLGTYVSEKVITYTGGILFLVFAAATLFEIFK